MDSKKRTLRKKLKDEEEILSEAPFGDVRVHYNSSRPAQLDADAFEEGPRKLRMD